MRGKRVGTPGSGRRRVARGWHSIAIVQRHILLVEDQDVAREALAEILRDEGYVVTTAIGGWPAIAQIERDPPDLIISDVRMPQGDGLAMLQDLRARPATAHIPVMLVSAFADWDRRVTAEDLGADDLVGKPVDVDLLLERVRAQLRRAEARATVEV
ncbi:MAG TPA: response regulator transcription factor [Kofleriaceae bacterium]|nr:response regulator transcription factor [Kofleriaceae bacterium]